MLTLFEAIKAIIKDPKLEFDSKATLLPDGLCYLLYADEELVLHDSHGGYDARYDLSKPVVCMVSNKYSDKKTVPILNALTASLIFDVHDPLDSLEFIKEWEFVDFQDRETEYRLDPILDPDTFKGMAVGETFMANAFKGYNDPVGSTQFFKLHLISESERTIYVEKVKRDDISNNTKRGISPLTNPMQILTDASSVVKLFNLISPIYEVLWFDDLEEKDRHRASGALRALARYKGSPAYKVHIVDVIGESKAKALISAGGLNFMDKEALYNVYAQLLDTLFKIATSGYTYLGADGQRCRIKDMCFTADESRPLHEPLYYHAYSVLKHLGVEKEHQVKQPLNYKKVGKR